MLRKNTFFLKIFKLFGWSSAYLVSRDGVGGRKSAGDWQRLTRGSVYKIDVVLSAGPGYCGNHIPIFTENTTASATYQLQEEGAVF